MKGYIKYFTYASSNGIKIEPFDLKYYISNIITIDNDKLTEAIKRLCFIMHYDLRYEQQPRIKNTECKYYNTCNNLQWHYGNISYLSVLLNWDINIGASVFTNRIPDGYVINNGYNYAIFELNDRTILVYEERSSKITKLISDIEKTNDNQQYLQQDISIIYSNIEKTNDNQKDLHDIIIHYNNIINKLFNIMNILLISDIVIICFYLLIRIY